MNMKTLVCFSVIAAILPACDVEQDLGETAGESSSGGSTGGPSTTGGADTGEDTGPWSGTGGSAEDTGALDTGPWSGTGEDTGSDTGGETGGESSGDSSGSSTTGEPVGNCDTSDVHVTWDWTTIDPEQLGYESLFIGVGDCSVLDQDAEQPLVTLALQCTLTGTRDDLAFEDEVIELDLAFEFDGGTPADLLPSLWPVLRARFYVGQAGFDLTGQRHVVLEQPMMPNDADAPVIIATDSTASLVPPAVIVGPYFAGEWYGGPTFTSAAPECVSGLAPECTADVALEAGWLDEAPVALHATEAGTFGAPTEGGSYDVYVRNAWEADGPCPPDFPGVHYDFVAFGATL